WCSWLLYSWLLCSWLRCCAAASVSRYALIKNGRRHENQDLPFEILGSTLPEQASKDRHVAENRHLLLLIGALLLEDSAQYHGLAVVDQDSRRQLAGVDRGNETAAPVGVELTHRVLLDLKLELNTVVRRDQWRRAKLGAGFLELDVDGAGHGATLG